MKKTKALLSGAYLQSSVESKKVAAKKSDLGKCHSEAKSGWKTSRSGPVSDGKPTEGFFVRATFKREAEYKMVLAMEK